MALGERAAARILAAEADGGFFREQGAEGERLGVCPIERSAVLERLRAAVEDGALDLWQNVESFRDRRERLDDLLEALDGNAGGNRLVGVAGLEDGGGAGEARFFLLLLGFLDGLERLVEAGLEFVFQGIGLLAR